MISNKIKFMNDSGVELSASLEMPLEGKPSAFAIFAHCFTCNKDYKAIYNISRALALNGVAVFRFDFTGLGESEGDFADTGFMSNVEDLVSASRYLESEFKAPDILIGHSLGGAAVLAAAHRIDSVKAVVTIAAPSSPDHLKSHLKEAIDQVRTDNEAQVSIAGRSFTIRKRFLEDLDSIGDKDRIAHLGRPLLILHSPDDAIVSFDHAMKIYEKAPHPRSIVSLDGADHLLSRREDSMYAGNVVASWVSRYVSLPVPESMESDKKVVVKTGEKEYTTYIKAGSHTFVSDEPESLGGNDLGPNPYDLVASGLGACTSITLRMYANRKGWDVKSIKVHLQHQKIHADDCSDCETKSGKIDVIERIIELEGNLDEDQRQRLLQIADRCPVHRTLHSEVVVQTRLKED